MSSLFQIKFILGIVHFSCALTGLVLALHAGDGPYFVTYSHQMEEPGNLEISLKNVVGRPGGDNRFLGTAAEFEYGLKAWWTTELYVEGQARSRDSAVFTGFRWENRFRLLPREHWINPVLYLELENINGANRSLLEVVGHDGESDLRGSNAENRLEKKRELEAKLILSSYFKGWNISENFIAEKNVRHAPFEFGYALGVNRPLALAARAGVEIYGGLGTHADFGLRNTSHYVAPTISWQVTDSTSLKVSPGFGITQASARFLLRLGMSYEFAQIRGRGRETRTLPDYLAKADSHASQSSNPFEGQELARSAGAKLYQHECSACHSSGRAPRLLNSSAVKDATPGALFWVIRNGSLRRGMPSFAHLPDEQRWQIVTFLKSR